MRRRKFLAGGPAVERAFAAGRGDMGNHTGNDTVTIGGFAVADLRERFRRELFDRFLPFFLEHMVDHTNGGFFPYTERDGTNTSGDLKTAWWTGRGLWTVSRLYTHFGDDPRLLEIGAKAADLLVRNRPDGDAFWPSPFTAEGIPVAKPSPALYDDMFAAEGLAEYAHASGDDALWDLARETVFKCMRRYDDPGYVYTSTYGLDTQPLPAPRIVGHWMVFIITATKMLRYRDDPGLRSLIYRSIEAILDAHMNPEFDLLNEVINHDMSRPDGAFSRFAYTSHGLETLWMIMWEADRRGDRALFDRAAAAFRRHVTVSWDDVYGGVYPGADDVEANRWQTSKQMWAQVEVLVGCLLLAAKTGDTWADDMFGRAYRYFYDNFSLADEGCPMLLLGGDRKLDPYKRPGVGGIFHQPRWMMLSLNFLDELTDTAT